MNNMALAVETGIHHGVLTLDKPAGWTSHDVVAKLRGVLRAAKVGHAGTLDPAATGVLPVLIGQATRIAEYLVGWDKEYRAVLRLGVTTDTQDATGHVLDHKPVPPLSLEQVREAARRFEGTITQIPPMYSAVKVAGVPLYRSARAGKTVSREARAITIHVLEVERVEGADVHLKVRCSKGTYIRTLCADLGEALGCGGHLLSLQRTRVGPLSIEHALSIEEVGRCAERGEIGRLLLTLDEALADLPSVTIDDATAARVMHGVAVPWAPALRELSLSIAPGGRREVRIKDKQGRLLALGLMAEEIDARTGAEPPPVGIRVRKVFGGQDQE